MERYDVFISYRRQGGLKSAKSICDFLTRKGYSVSFDVENLREGRFDNSLLFRVENCIDFILIVDNKCFEKTINNTCNLEDDWLRMELSSALRLKKNIIPIFLSDSSFPNNLPKDIIEVIKYNGIDFPEVIQGKLEHFLHSQPRNTAIVPTNSTSSHNLKIKCNIDYVFFIDGVKLGEFNADNIIKVPLSPGEYLLQFISKENKEDSFEECFCMPNSDKLYSVDLLAIKKVREGKECKEREEEKKRREAKEEEKKKVIDSRIAEKKQKIRENGFELFKIDNIPFKMVYVEGGRFVMGYKSESINNPKDIPSNELPPHLVTLDDYLIGETEVTQDLWDTIMGNNPSQYRCKDLPVEHVSWYDVQQFIAKLNTLTNREFRLPTEAEWEYAASGGLKGNSYLFSGSNNIQEVAWYGVTIGTNHVKSKKPNELGLYDMSGNVWEWCSDCFGYYNGHSQHNPQGPQTGTFRVFRGGSWSNSAKYCRITNRNFKEPTSKDNSIGFRLALNP